MNAWLLGYSVVGFLVMCFQMAGAMIRLNETRPAVVFIGGLMAGAFWPAFVMMIMLAATGNTARKP